MIGDRDDSWSDDTILSRLINIGINDDTDSVESELSISEPYINGSNTFP